MCLYVYIYMYKWIYTERERERIYIYINLHFHFPFCIWCMFCCFMWDYTLCCTVMQGWSTSAGLPYIYYTHMPTRRRTVDSLSFPRVAGAVKHPQNVRLCCNGLLCFFFPQNLRPREMGTWDSMDTEQLPTTVGFRLWRHDDDDDVHTWFCLKWLMLDFL